MESLFILEPESKLAANAMASPGDEHHVPRHRPAGSGEKMIEMDEMDRHPHYLRGLGLYTL